MSHDSFGEYRMNRQTWLVNLNSLGSILSIHSIGWIYFLNTKQTWSFLLLYFPEKNKFKNHWKTRQSLEVICAPKFIYVRGIVIGIMLLVCMGMRFYWDIFNALTVISPRLQEFLRPINMWTCVTHKYH